MSQNKDVLWTGKPSPESFIGAYFLYTSPFMGQIIAYVLWLAIPAQWREYMQFLSYPSHVITRLSYPASLIYLLGFFLAVIFCLINWLVRVDFKPLLYTLLSYFTIEILRAYTALTDYRGALLALLAFSTFGVLLVELYRRSFTYIVKTDSIVIRGGFVTKWERFVRKNFVSDVIVVRPILGYIFGYAHVIPVTQSQIGLGDTFSLGALTVGAKKSGVIVGGGKSVVSVEPRPWNCIFGVRNLSQVKKAVLE
ncbi:MAG: PH domain-containing protein [Infirmifilum sp.]